ncbi:MAG: lipid-A-disaccharide synthase [Acidobacteriia bacterium]|jgi:lipid-A-disaccharide synthase|nr:lipid-A-disaccharide synthase [Terriglobia bacterium]
MNPPTILLSAGDTSGEMYAAHLAAALQRRTGAVLFGMGGAQMRQAGVELVADYHRLHVVGITEVLSRLPTVWHTWRTLTREARRRRPQLAVLVDSPGFHFGLARRLQKQGIRNVYFIGPQVWAWRPGRVKWIRERFERVICIFPFEEAFYRRHGVRADYVGHPLVDTVRASRSRAEFLAAHGLTEDPLIALLPGSRSSEVRRHLPRMLAALQRIHERKRCQAVLAAAPNLPKNLFAAVAMAGVPLRVVSGATYDALAAADLAIVSSGTATIEAALLGTPMIIVYRLSPLTALLARRLVRTPYFGMVNLIAGRRLVPEFFQQEFTPEAIAREALRLLDMPAEREEIRRGLAEVREQLGPGGAIERAAEIIVRLLPV